MVVKEVVYGVLGLSCLGFLVFLVVMFRILNGILKATEDFEDVYEEN
jgi:hypothetical protein